MTTTMLGPILVLGDPDGALTAQLRGLGEVETVDDVELCLDRAATLRGAGRPPRLVAVAPTLLQPLTAARRLRVEDAALGLVVVVPPSEVAATETRLAFVPDLADVAVVPSEPQSLLVTEMQRTTEAAAHRSQLDRALHLMNLELDAVQPDRETVDDRRGMRRSVSERYLAALLRNAPDAIVSLDDHRRVVTTNAAAAAILGFGEDAEGRPVEALLRAEDPELLHTVMEEVEAGRARRDVELWVGHPRGEHVLLSLTAAPVRSTADMPAGAVLLARDITAQRRADEQLRQLQREEGLATLAGGVAHDFNNLLMTIRGWASMAAQDPADEDIVRTALGHIEVASERAAELSRALLAYSGRATTDRQAVDPNELVTGMVGLFDASVPSDITVELHLADEVPALQADPTQLRQVLLNLVTNAAEAIGERPGRIDVSTQRTHDGRVELTVTDTGPGMDDTTRARIFEPFFTTRFTGRGLGLAATMGIVRAHDGSIVVESEPGEGARFVVSLPAAEPTEPR